MRKIVFIVLAALVVPRMLMGSISQIPTLVPIVDQRKRPAGWTIGDLNRIAALKSIRSDVTRAEFWAKWDDPDTPAKRFIEDTCFLNSWAYSAACNPEITRIMNKAVEFASTPERYKELRDLIEKIRTSSQASIFFPAVAAADEVLKQKEGASATSLSPQDENAALKREIAALQKDISALLARIKELERGPSAIRTQPLPQMVPGMPPGMKLHPQAPMYDSEIRDEGYWFKRGRIGPRSSK